MYPVIVIESSNTGVMNAVFVQSRMVEILYRNCE